MENLSRKYEMHVNPGTLAFTGVDKKLEKPYRTYYNNSSRKQLRIAFVISIVLIAAFGILDLILLPQQKLAVWFMRFFLLIPAILIGFAFTFNPNVVKVFPGMQLVLLALVAGGFLWMVITSAPPGNHLYYGGLVLALMFGYSCVRLSFFWASLAGGVIVAAYEIIGWNFTEIPHSILFSNSFYLVAANFIGMVACYTIERNHRHSYLLAHYLMEEQKNVISTNELLEKRVAERTMELEETNQALQNKIAEKKLFEEQTRQAQKIESIGLLAGGIAHDFNNILTIIIGNASLLNMGKMEPEKISHHINAIANSANRGAQLVNQLLTFARKTETIYSPLDVNKIALDVCGLLSETFQKNISVQTKLAENLPLINADSVQIHQVFMNICINARDAMPSGGTITIVTKTVEGEHIRLFYPQATDRQYVCISIADTGTGIDQETQKKIFDPFFTTKETGKGTGLGLSVVYGIIECHHGYIKVNSTINQGTEFVMFLPQPEETTVCESKPSIGFPLMNGEGKSILIVDDEKDILEILKDFLEDSGYTVFTAHNGEQAIDIFLKNAAIVSLVITDKDMPKMSGEDVFKNIRAVSPTVPCIMLTGLLDPQEKQNWIDSGISCILHKPISAQEFLTAVSKVLFQNK